jgi:hypothetical protein
MRRALRSLGAGDGGVALVAPLDAAHASHVRFPRLVPLPRQPLDVSSQATDGVVRGCGVAVPASVRDESEVPLAGVALLRQPLDVGLRLLGADDGLRPFGADAVGVLAPVPLPLLVLLAVLLHLRPRLVPLLDDAAGGVGYRFLWLGAERLPNGGHGPN